MQVVFRVDASTAIGSGHVMRCLTLAEALRNNGAKVSFVSRENPGHLCDIVESRNFAVKRLLPIEGIAKQRPEEASLEFQDIDAREMIGLLGDLASVDWLVVDHYTLDQRWESRLRPLVHRILVIDDLANRSHNCDLLLDQNLSRNPESRYAGLVSPLCRVLVGPRYALLRPEFRHWRERRQVRTGEVRRILVSFGGSDPTNETAKAVEAIRLLARPDIAVDVVLGATNPNRESVRRICVDLPNFSLLVQVPNMAELLAAADLAIGAVGTTTWERCCMGLPSIVVATAENQEIAASTLAEQGRLLYVGKGESVTAELLRDAISTAVNSGPLLRFLSMSNVKLVDGRGADRIVTAMQSNRLAVRPATVMNCRQVYEWRNHPDVRKVAMHAESIAWNDHERWFSDALTRSDRTILIGYEGESAVGVVRFDAVGVEAAEVSIYLGPEQVGRGYGSILLRAAENWFTQQNPQLQRFIAKVLDGNVASQRLFEHAGYTRRYISYEKKLTA